MDISMMKKITLHKGKMIGIAAIFVLLAIITFLMSGCSILTSKSTKLRDLDFTVVSEELITPELKQLLDERMAAPFKITYHDNEFLYICVGYGEQPTGGYSIAVNELYLTDDAIHISTSLLGPDSNDATNSALSYPMIVVKTEYLDKTVVFE